MPDGGPHPSRTPGGWASSTPPPGVGSMGTPEGVAGVRGGTRSWAFATCEIFQMGSAFRIRKRAKPLSAKAEAPRGMRKPGPHGPDRTRHRPLSRGFVRKCGRPARRRSVPHRASGTHRVPPGQPVRLGRAPQPASGLGWAKANVRKCGRPLTTAVLRTPGTKPEQASALTPKRPPQIRTPLAAKPCP